MAFIILMVVLGSAGLAIERLRGRSSSWRSAMRFGMGAAFVLIGFDHFLHLEARYVLMIPGYLQNWARPLVMTSGAMELCGGLALLVPAAHWARHGLPNLRPIAGIGLAMLMSAMVIANAHVAASSHIVAGLPSDQTYLALRPLLQPFLVLWALWCSEAIYPPKAADSAGAS